MQVQGASRAILRNRRRGLGVLVQLGGMGAIKLDQAGCGPESGFHLGNSLRYTVRYSESGRS
jgi:hypothetical protein